MKKKITPFFTHVRARAKDTEGVQCVGTIVEWGLDQMQQILADVCKRNLLISRFQKTVLIICCVVLLIESLITNYELLSVLL